MASVNSEHNSSSAVSGLPLLHKLPPSFDGIPAERIRLQPPPGQATLQDAIDIDAHEDLACELVDGVILEKTVGYFESSLAVWVAFFIRTYLNQHDLGMVLGEGGSLRILPNQVRIPDVCFISWSKFPDRKLPREPMPPIAPDLAVEILSKSNSKAEMDRKLKDYFAAGVQLVWYIDAETAETQVYTSYDNCLVLGRDGTLDGGSVLPGFQLSIRELFFKAGEPAK